MTPPFHWASEEHFDHLLDVEGVAMKLASEDDHFFGDAEYGDCVLCDAPSVATRGHAPTCYISELRRLRRMAGAWTACPLVLYNERDKSGVVLHCTREDGHGGEHFFHNDGPPFTAVPLLP